MPNTESTEGSPPTKLSDGRIRVRKKAERAPVDDAVLCEMHEVTDDEQKPESPRTTDRAPSMNRVIFVSSGWLFN